MRKVVTGLSCVAALAVLAGCAMQPVGPTISVFPAPYKPFDVFLADQDECQDYAASRTAGAAQAANNRALGAAAVGTALGLAVGAATGDGRAASFGAASGAAVGTAVGASQSDQANFSLQRRYDVAYAQCMYAKGNQVPGFQRLAAPPPPPPPPGGPPPPPPPPPPGRG
jgi:hypothetical protein